MSAPKYLDFPFHVDGRGRAALTNTDDHVRDLIMAVLFTSPGERVNVPDFGCGLRQLVFAPNSDFLASATEALVGAALDRWLADWIVVDRVEIVPQDEVLNIRISYRRRDTQQPMLLEIQR
jgi:phage baseplate assembly protein W